MHRRIDVRMQLGHFVTFEQQMRASEVANVALYFYHLAADARQAILAGKRVE
jgi:hypothetical protein